MEKIKKYLETVLSNEKFKKIIKGALIAGSGTAVLFVLDSLSSIEFKNANIAAAVTFFVPVAVNAIKEFMKK